MLINAVDKLLAEMLRWQSAVSSNVAGHRSLRCLEHLWVDVRHHALLEVPVLVQAVGLRLAVADADIEPLGHRCNHAQTEFAAFGVQGCPYQVRVRAVL